MKLTDSAINKVKQLLDEELDPELKLRISVNGGGCSGFKYDLGFDNTKEFDDIIVEVASSDNTVTVPVIIDPISMAYLTEVVVDYTDGLMAQFIINNPAATSTCGCGSSFSA